MELPGKDFWSIVPSETTPKKEILTETIAFPQTMKKFGSLKVYVYT